jgi:hypothetical protein
MGMVSNKLVLIIPSFGGILFISWVRGDGRTKFKVEIVCVVCCEC